MRGSGDRLLGGEAAGATPDELGDTMSLRERAQRRDKRSGHLIDASEALPLARSERQDDVMADLGGASSNRPAIDLQVRLQDELETPVDVLEHMLVIGA